MEAEYTLQQAIALVNLNAEQLHQHLINCTMCMELYGEFCEDGERLIQNRVKWRRRVKYAAKREGVSITV
jgi:hypothetical protein